MGPLGGKQWLVEGTRRRDCSLSDTRPKLRCTRVCLQSANIRNIKRLNSTDRDRCKILILEVGYFAKPKGSGVAAPCPPQRATAKQFAPKIALQRAARLDQSPIKRKTTHKIKKRQRAWCSPSQCAISRTSSPPNNINLLTSPGTLQITPFRINGLLI